MFIFFIYFLFTYFPISLKLLNAYPTQDSTKDGIQSSEATTYTTTVVDNSTENIFSSVWHKISNIFSEEETTTTKEESETRPAVLMPEDRRPPSGKEQGSDRELRMAPLDFSRRENDAMWQKELDDEGNSFPIHQQLRMQRSDLEDAPKGGEEIAAEEVRTRDSKHNNRVLFRMKRATQHPVINKTVPIIVEEFGQGETEGERIKRFNDIQKSSDWKTEKIVEGSDPVENIDRENYIEETKNDNFPFHELFAKPIIVEDSFSQETTAQSQKELPPLKIIEI